VLTHLYPIASLLIVALGGLGVMAVDAIHGTRSENDSPQGLSLTTAVILWLAGLLSIAWVAYPVSVSVDTSVVLRAVAPWLALDAGASIWDALICISAGFCVLLAGSYLHEHRLERGEFYPLVLFTTLGAMVLARSTDLLSAFLGLEMMSLGVYALVAYRRTSPRAAEASLKYFLLGSFATAIFLFGVALLYGATGSTQLEKIAGVLSGSSVDARIVGLAIALVTIGIAFKFSAVPFHMWTPDAYEGAITPVTVFMAVVVKAAVLGLAVRVFGGALIDTLSASATAGWPPVLAALAVASMVLGNLAALVQSNIKRMLAYSSIAHAGYLLVGIIAAQKLGASEQTFAPSAVVFYVGAYAVSSILALGALIAMGSRGAEVVSFDDLAGAGARHPGLGVMFAIGVLSLMGFPPTAGFFGKYYIFSSAVQCGGGMVWLALIGMMTSAVGAYYYLRVVVFLFMKTPEPDAPIAVPMRSAQVGFVLAVAAVLVLQMGLQPASYLHVLSKL
jgi:NADH-quinone oxidoreductase subunit N